MPRRAMETACQLAAEHGACVTVVAVIEVPVELPLDAHMIEEEAEAKRLLECARAVADDYGVKASTSLVRSREAGQAIVEEARRADAEIIILRAPHKRKVRRAASLFGETVDFVLKHASCRVMLSSTPAA
jgi:nucleotide-binding universal stress UspA family protein